MSNDLPVPALVMLKSDDEKLENNVEMGDSPKSANNEPAKQETVVRTLEEAGIERRLLLKADLLILPLLFVSYLLDFLDRSDIGNAAVAGMTADLHMSSQQLSTAAAMIYVTYIIFQFPANFSLKYISPQLQLALAMAVWGLCNTLISVAQNYATVLGLRLGVGFGEAFFQAAPIYISLWYKRNEYSKRVAVIFSASAAAGALNGLLAYAIEKNLNGQDGLAAWRWLFIIEGSISIGWGFVMLFFLPATPEKARLFFTAAEKSLATQRSREAYNDPHASIRWRDIWKVFRGWNIYLFCIVFSCSNISLTSLSTFLPVILRTLHYSQLEAQLLTIPVYAVAAVSTLIIAYLSDHFKRRGYFMLGAYVLSIVGWLLLLVSKNHELSFAATFIVGAGTFPSMMLTFSWVVNNQAGFTRRASTYAVSSMVAQCFSIVATEIYSDPPTYYRGNGFALGSAVVGFCATVILVIKLQRGNRRKREAADTEIARIQRLQSFEELGDEHPDFYFYT